MVLRITKQLSFEMAHALLGYDGKCQNIHGHSYKLFVTVEGVPLHDNNNHKNGMVMDFGDVKRCIEETIIQKFDHALVMPQSDRYNPEALKPIAKLLVVPFQPTTENLLMHFAELLQPAIPQNLKLYSLRLHETETSYAELFL